MTKIFVAGHNGMVGSAILRQLQKEAFVDVITATREELDLTNQHQVNQFFKLMLLIRFIWLQLKWEEFTLTIHIRLSLCMRT